MATGTIISHDASGVFDKVTKSAVMKMLVTPLISSNAAMVASSVSVPATNVAGPPTSTPTPNFRAFGLGVLDTCTVMSVERSVPASATRFDS